VALPGGAIEPEDGSAEAAAVREAHEEVGLDADAAGLTVLGQLGPVEVRVSGFRLVGVVAVAQTEPSLVADPWEVASILLPPADAFLPHAPIEVVELERDGWRLRYGAYPIEGARVWGATARLLAQLGGLLGGANPGGA
jgi:8-oxo-dGTP pyrophosphatase MutT (NUDIX family)